MQKILFCILLLNSIILYSQVRSYTNEFLYLGVDARSMAMSNAVVSSTYNVNAGYWNPALLVFTPGYPQFSLMHAEYFAGIANYNSFAISFHQKDSIAFGFTYLRFAVDDIPNTTQLIDNNGQVHYDKITSFTAADNAFLLSIGKKINHKMQIGGTVKIIRRVIGDFAGAWGFGLDIGASYMSDRWRAGIVLRDITSTPTFWSFSLNDAMKEVFTLTGNEIPKNSLELGIPRLATGISYIQPLLNNFSLQPELALIFTFDGQRNTLINNKIFSIDPSLGLEIAFKQMIFLRAGIGNFQQETFPNGKKWTMQPNIGIGIAIKNILQLDYAYTDIGEKSIALYSNVISLIYHIKKHSQASL
ncbi:MAG TPA: PorV/PorQ family protein [Bacteroidales bacterium]|nr:PorV/PorQ family protein [Bacteroidales bacterium]HOU82599.1 PorV/PorQ family protein [Bacteroidales bacterium]HOV55282.1 PorV/PorQ family protein [Bacteroidales bacterium]HRC78348.1 PorV/PorQ family protein [Bacteroidales bacterium]HRR52586.1 PorV/PorQ family protein [Bacteroidales bacterium]